MTVEIIDALEWVRSRPRQFFGRDRPDPVHLLAYLMADVVELGNGECLIRKSGRWWIIGSDFNWLANASCAIPELFRRVVPAPQHGEHSMRGEVLLGAFCSDISVIGTDGVTRVLGDEPEEATLLKVAGVRHAIMFRLP
jgi:hypothetical protein